MTVAIDLGSRALRRRAELLAWATIGWNTVEAVVAIGAGAAAGSAALVSFGLDSTVEVSAALVALWYLRGAGDERGRRAGRLIAVSFWALAGWVGYDAVTDLVQASRPETSTVGIAMTSLSIVVMPLLARAKRHNARALGSKALESEAAETRLCAWISTFALAGVTLNALAGWWWADPIAALVIAAVAIREGREAWSGEFDEESCCS